MFTFPLRSLFSHYQGIWNLPGCSFPNCIIVMPESLQGKVLAVQEFREGVEVMQMEREIHWRDP
jgi:hypothetical protein